MQADLFVPYAKGQRLMRGWRGVVDARAALAGAVAVVAAGIRVAAGSQPGSSLAAAISVGALIIAFAFVYVQLRTKNAGIYFREGTVGVADALGRRRGVKVAQIDQLQLCCVAAANVRTPIRLLLFIDRNGRAMLRFYGADALVPEGIEKLAERSGVPVQGSWDDQYSPGELQKRYPGALPPLQIASYSILDHPRRTAWFFGGLTVLAFIALAAALLSRSAP